RATRMQDEARDIVSGLVRGQNPFYLMPLQLQCDYQLRHNASYSHQGDAIREIITSFAEHAPQAEKLIFKCHPLDNGGENWPRHIKEGIAATSLGDGRILYIE